MRIRDSVGTGRAVALALLGFASKTLAPTALVVLALAAPATAQVREARDTGETKKVRTPEVPPARPDTGGSDGSGTGEAGDGAGIGKPEREARGGEGTSPTWRTWLERNLHAWLPGQLDSPGARSGLALSVLDPLVRTEKRALYRDEVTTRLELLLSDGDHRVRGAAAVALARVGVDGHTTQLLELLADPERRVRDQALLASALADGTAARYHLLHLAAGIRPAGTDPSAAGDFDRTRALAALFVALRGEPVLYRLVEDAAADRSLATQYRALLVQAIGLCGQVDALPWLLELARNRSEPGLVRAAAATAMGRLGDPAASACLLQLLENRDHDTEVRASAALAVGDLVRATDVEAVRQILRAFDREGNATVAQFLLISLGRIGGHAAILKIERTYEHANGDQRAFAALALGLAARAGGSGQELAPLLEAARDDRILDQRCAALCALGLSQQPQAIEPLTAAAADGNSADLRRCAVTGLLLLGRAGGVPTLQHLLLADDAPEVRKEAARALARLDPASTSVLFQAIGTRSRGTEERATMILALGLTRDPTALPMLLDRLRDKGAPSQEREAAVLALGLIYEPRLAPPTAIVGEAKSFVRESGEIPDLLTLAE